MKKVSSVTPFEQHSMEVKWTQRFIIHPYILFGSVIGVTLFLLLKATERQYTDSTRWQYPSRVLNHSFIVNQYLSSNKHWAKGNITQPNIPHILHQSWNTYNVPTAFQKWIQSWVERHPHWEYWFWTPKDAKALIQKHYPNFMSMYDKYQPSIEVKTDAMRYFIMEQYGGVYVDIDMENLRNIDEWTYKYNCFITEDTYEHSFLWHRNSRSWMTNIIVACRPHHPFYNFTIQRLPFNALAEVASQVNGPVFLDRAYLAYNESTRNQNDLKEIDKVASIRPEYFLPTFDSQMPVQVQEFCANSKYSKLTKNQNLICMDLLQRDFRNEPRPFSYTVHHWFHAVRKHFLWKYFTSTVDIRDIVPHVKKPPV